MIKQALLGTAFAAADLIFEVDAAGKITFALGSIQGLAVTANGALEGQNWRNLFRAEDQTLLAALLRSVKPGERKGPMKVVLATDREDSPGRAATLSVFRLPDRADRSMSCALSFKSTAWGEADLDLAPGEDFPAAVARCLQEAERAGLPLQIDLVQLDGLAASEAIGGGVRGRVVATLRANSLNGEGASELAPDRFAVVRSALQPASDFQAQLKEAAGAKLKPVMASLPLSVGSVDEKLRALRYALDQYIGAGAGAASIDFGAIVKKTAAETARLKSALSAHAWQLVYQPVVNLETERLHHFEALVRFEAGASPQGAVYLAEELGLIADFDLDVAKHVAKVLADGAPTISIAVNVSASSLMQPAFSSALAKVTERNPKLRSRLALEITETQKLTDLPAANAAIQALRRIGHAVCLDDFGAGAASLDYLRQLDVDFVKFDGRYIKSLKAESRDEVVLRHMVSLCRELGIETIAEMIEAPQTARLAKSLGVSLGQGWCFAKPCADLIYPPPEKKAQPVRRMGVVETWS